MKKRVVFGYLSWQLLLKFWDTPAWLYPGLAAVVAMSVSPRETGGDAKGNKNKK